MQTYSQGQLKKAQEFIDDLRRENGGITKEDREFLKREKPDILKSFDNIRRKLGASTQIVAEQLYQKSTRFVYELIQNAEESKYTAPTELPCLSFTLQTDRVIIDSNEDGFTQRDIKAICSIGESTKASIQGYIGEKGIGFKSVFKVAHKVHIQSGPYSFVFEYHKGDSVDCGLGMVTPMNEIPHELPDDVRTRMILYLHEDEDRAALCQDLLNLPDTLLLFLKKLRRLTVKFELPDRDIQKIQFSLIRPNNNILSENIVRIETAIAGTINLVTPKSFWVKKRRVVNLPADSARDQTHEAEIVLAFPVDEYDIPVIEEQYAFAFLPLEKFGYKFIIQSDFITTASREDIVDSAWNRQLLEEVVATFCSAISDPNGFLEHDTLRYSWIRYIPTTTITDEFWGLLQLRLFDELCTSKFFFSLDGSRWSPNRLRVLQNIFRDEHRAPLLADTVAGTTAYISAFYNASDIPILEKMKAKHLDTGEFLQRLDQDLVRTHDSRMQTTPLSSPWHTRMANLLISMGQDDSDKMKIQKLNIIPLDSGIWARPLNASIFFPNSGGVDIPKGLPLNLVDGKALGNPSRKKLFSQLGVAECSPERIFFLIQQRCLPLVKGCSASDLQDIKFLFWHHVELAVDYPINMWLWNGEKYTKASPQKDGWVYLPRCENTYALANLFGTSVPVELRSSNKVRYIVSNYYKILESCGSRHGHTGIEWLCSLGIKETPQLRARNSKGHFQNLAMSAELNYIAEKLPGSLLGVLQANFIQYIKLPQWDSFFRLKKVPILASSEMRRLYSTYLPLPKLKAIASSLGLEEGCGFLRELDGISEFEVIKWNFLRRFGVGVDEDVSFWLKLLKQAGLKDSINPSVVFRIYKKLQSYVDESDVKKIKNLFTDDMIFAPSSNSMDDWDWAHADECVWSGPKWFGYKHCLQDIRGYQTLQALFVNTVGISDATLTDFLEYLEIIKFLDQDESEGDFNGEKHKIILLYDKLNELTDDGKSSEEVEIVRSYFEDWELLYYPPSRSWCAPSSCIWAPEKIQFLGKISIATKYKKRRTFFQDVLGIKKPNVEMHILALQKHALENPDKEAILRELRNLCALLPTRNVLRDKLSKCKCFPVYRPSQIVEWMDSTGSFAIVDRKEHGDVFKNEINVLDFSLEEVHSVNKFLVEFGLEGRFTSRAVEEDTKIEDGLLNDALTNDLRRKAYAICRYAAHYGSNDARSSYDLLRNLEVFTSESITKEISIAQNRIVTSVKVHIAFLHIAQVDDQLKLYVPKEQRQREVCLSHQLPIELLKHLGVSNFHKGAELGSVIRATSSFAIDAILDSDGIIDVPGLPHPEDYSESEPSTSDASQDIASPAINTGAESRVASSQLHYRAQPSTKEYYVQAQTVHGSLRTLATPGTHAPEIPPERPNLFNELLDTVIKQARSIHNIPAINHVVLAPLSLNARVETSLAVGSNVTGEIGVAGELFMFEIMKSLGLPLFDLRNWRSTIRHRVTVHDDYKDMPRWSGSETSDIVYEDHDKILTSLLITKNYFNIEELAGLEFASSPTYYIEVKTTPGPLDNAFYCSQGQFDRMESMKLQPDKLVDEVYLIARVFNLGASGIGFKLYVDPAGLRRKGQLRFAADKYVVTS
ncbi:hypothetical protein EAE96_002461 [Botrytis aclada]|nr:hypothetical protein EAE96_002461 [Botrytis aclada]